MDHEAELEIVPIVEGDDATTSIVLPLTVVVTGDAIIAAAADIT